MIEEAAYKKEMRRLAKMHFLHFVVALSFMSLPIIFEGDLTPFVGFFGMGMWIYLLGGANAKKIFTLKREYIKGWDETTGQVTRDIWDKKEREFRYEYDGQVFSGRTTYGIAVDGAIEGERYVLQVNPRNPHEYYPLDWRPLFAEEEQYDTTVGTISKVSKANFFSKPGVFAVHRVYFSYE